MKRLGRPQSFTTGLARPRKKAHFLTGKLNKNQGDFFIVEIIRGALFIGPRSKF
jgi:hypothetical protein